MDSGTVIKEPKQNKAGEPAQLLGSKPDVVSVSQFKTLHPTGGAIAKSQPKDAGAKDRKSGAGSKDAKMALPQPTVQQQEGDGDEWGMFGNLFGVEDEEDIQQDRGFDVDMYQPPEIRTKPLAVPLGAGGGDKKSGNGGKKCRGGNEIQTQIKGNGNDGGKRVYGVKQNRGGHGSTGAGRQMQNVNYVAPGGGAIAALGGMTGGAGFPGMCQTGSGPVDRPQTGTGSMKHAGMPAPGFYQGAASATMTTSTPSGPEMKKDDVVAGSTIGARQQYVTRSQQQQQPKVSKSKKMQ